MRLVQLNQFNFRGGAIPDDEKVVALGIAPSSDIDTVLVNGRELGPKAIMPYTRNATLAPVRGWRTGGLTIARAKPVPDVFSNNEPGLAASLDLIVYECGDALVPPGPRAPQIVDTRVSGAEVQNAGNTLALRQICHGRRHGSIYVRRGNGASSAVTISLRLVQYFAPDVCKVMKEKFIDGVHQSDHVPYIWEAQAGQSLADAAQLGTISNNADVLACVYHWGGEDSLECPDEVEVYLGFDTDSTTNLLESDWWVRSQVDGELA